MDKSITTFGSIKVFITLFFTNCSFITKSSINFSPTRNILWWLFLPLPIFFDVRLSSIHFASQLQGGNVYVIRQEDLDSAQGPVPADLVAHQSLVIQETCADEDDDVFDLLAQFELSSYPLLPMCATLILFSSCWASSSTCATSCRFAICTHSGFHKHTLLLAQFWLFSSLSLALPRLTCLCMHTSTNSQLWFSSFFHGTTSSMHVSLARRPPTTRRIFLAQPLVFFTTTLCNGCLAPLCVQFVNFQFSSHQLPQRATQAVPVRRVHTSLNVCDVQLLPRTTPCVAMHKPAPVRSW